MLLPSMSMCMNFSRVGVTCRFAPSDTTSRRDYNRPSLKTIARACTHTHTHTHTHPHTSTHIHHRVHLPFVLLAPSADGCCIILRHAAIGYGTQECLDAAARVFACIFVFVLLSPNFRFARALFIIHTVTMYKLPEGDQCQSSFRIYTTARLAVSPFCPQCQMMYNCTQ